MTNDLHVALEASFGRCVKALERQTSEYSSSFAIEELVVQFEDGEAVNVVFKNLSRTGILDSARLVKPDFLYSPCREINVYRYLLPLLNLGAPKLYGVRGDWLFLELVEAPELWQIGEFQVWLDTARWLSKLHSAPASESATARRHVPQLIEHDADYYQRWITRARSLAGDPLEAIADVCADAIGNLLKLPPTLIHGEFYASNILVDQQSTGLRICPVDWEMAAVGPGILDVAALASGSWNREERLAMLDAYCADLPADLRPPDPVQAFDSARLQIALQWLGWAPDWSPHSQHAQDWLAEALDAAAALSGPATRR